MRTLIAPCVQEMDSYEFAEPADILSSLGKEFWEGLGAKKWTERRDALAKLKGVASQPRLAPGDYGDVLRELRKIIQKDSMVVIVGEAILCVGAMAKSLRSNFSVRSWQSYISDAFSSQRQFMHAWQHPNLKALREHKHKRRVSMSIAVHSQKLQMLL